jgi:HEPN domain-containing protein
MAKRLASAAPPFHDGVCFHCQQLAEKYLKGLLQEGGIIFPKSHDLLHLLGLLLPGDATLKTLWRGLRTLNRYAVDFRYPGVNATKRQARTALRLACRVRAEIRVRLGLDVT